MGPGVVDREGRAIVAGNFMGSYDVGGSQQASGTAAAMFVAALGP